MISGFVGNIERENYFILVCIDWSFDILYSQYLIIKPSNMVIVLFFVKELLEKSYLIKFLHPIWHMHY